MGQVHTFQRFALSLSQTQTGLYKIDIIYKQVTHLHEQTKNKKNKIKPIIAS